MNQLSTNMKFCKEKAVTFAGHRILTSVNGCPDANLENVIRTEVSFCLQDCYHEGKNVFIIGMAIGWDMLCAEEVLKLKMKYPDVVLIAVIPFMDQELMYSSKDKQRYKRIYDAANHRELITDNDNSKDADYKCTEWMVANSSELIAYDSGKPRSGTVSIISKAQKNGLEVFNIFDELSDYFTIVHPAKQYLQSFPHITSFRYGRDGVIFEGHNQLFPVKFSEIERIEHKKESLCFILSDGLKIFASLTSDEVRVPFARFTEDC